MYYRVLLRVGGILHRLTPPLVSKEMLLNEAAVHKSYSAFRLVKYHFLLRV